MQRFPTILAAALVLTSAAGSPGQQQSQQEQEIAARVKQVGNGTVRLTFASQPGVCGDGDSFISSTGMNAGGDRRSVFRHSRGGVNVSIGSSERDWEDCEEGPLRVALEVENGAVTDVQTYVGKSWDANEPAMTVSVKSAVAYLLTVAEHGNEDAGRHVMIPIVLADSVEPWPELLRIGRNERTPQETRKSAIFWVGQSNDPAMLPGLKSLMTSADEEIGKSATFSISQMRSEASNRILIETARNTGVDREVRKSAIFWLGQAAGDKATQGLKDLTSDEDVEVKKSAVFALSQIKSEQSVNALIDIVKNSRDKEVRKSALFWLSQSDDPRVLSLYEDILFK